MRIYKFRNCYLNCTERRVIKDGNYLELTPKTFDVLQLLVERAGEVVTKDEILGTVWNGSFVEEGNLPVHISKLRVALGEKKSERYIETVSGNGYRFIPSVKRIKEDRTDDRTDSTVREQSSFLNELSAWDSESVRLYLKGKYFFEKCTVVSLNKAIEYFEKSIAYDPVNVYANVQLVESYLSLYGLDYISNSDVLTKIKPILAIVSDLDQNNDVLQVMYGSVKMSLEWEFDEAETHFSKALSINPGSLNAHYRYMKLLILLSRFSEALKMLPQTTHLDPFSLPTYLRIGRLFYLMGRYDNALLYLRDAIDLEPDHFETLLVLGAVLTETENYPDALDAFQKSLESNFDIETLSMIGYLHACKAESKETSDIIERIEAYASNGRSFNIQLASIYLTMGQKEIGYSLSGSSFDRQKSLSVLL